MDRQLRIDQVLPSFGFYDAIGTECRLIRDFIRQKGITSDIFVDEGLYPEETRPMQEFHNLKPDSGNLVIHHLSIGSLVPYYLMGYQGGVITRYHNITPARFFKYPSNQLTRFRCQIGRMQFQAVRKFSHTIWAASRYNLEEMDRFRFKEKHILPVVRDYQYLTSLPDCVKTTKILQKNPRKTILFVGRVIPSKSHHDLIFYLSELQHIVSPNVRIIFVGSGDPYYVKTLLRRLANDMQLQVAHACHSSSDPDILFTGSVSEKELVSYYRHADAFVCVSDHEGFCVPLIEAMHFGLPVLAHPAAAVPDTLGFAGIQADKNKPAEFLKALSSILWNEALIKDQRDKSLLRAQDFSWDSLSRRLEQLLGRLIRPGHSGMGAVI